MCYSSITVGSLHASHWVKSLSKFPSQYETTYINRFFMGAFLSATVTPPLCLDTSRKDTVRVLRSGDTRG